MVTRNLDRLGRITIPKQFFEKLAFEQFQKCEITIEYGGICIKAFDGENIETRPNIGMVRRLDGLFRMSIPSEYREVLGIRRNSIHEMILDGKTIKIVTEEIKKESSE